MILYIEAKEVSGLLVVNERNKKEGERNIGSKTRDRRVLFDVRPRQGKWHTRASAE